ncbi:hypothetical protein NA78x_001088 [Anatilimnocola sp. NA78]|uniref:hypothetical protein n=1 Tax=Anatilimnocola sp. NA78 TaxID=3415683 RepID=UPI003CE46CE9
MSPQAKKFKSTSPSKLEQNLGYSMQAVNFVLTRAKLQAANYDYFDPQKKAATFEIFAKQLNNYQPQTEYDALYKLAEAHKTPLDQCVYDGVRPVQHLVTGIAADLGFDSEMDRYRIIAALAMMAGCGNCQEESIVAFLYLHDMKVRAHRISAKPDHAFVVVGMAPNADFEDYRTWGTDAVICDPWSQGFQKGNAKFGTYPASQFNSVMGSLLGAITIEACFPAP